jgi:hypothetical protein
MYDNFVLLWSKNFTSENHFSMGRNPVSVAGIDAHRGVRGERGIKMYPPSKFFAKLVNKNAIKHQ